MSEPTRKSTNPNATRKQSSDSTATRKTVASTGKLAGGTQGRNDSVVAGLSLPEPVLPPGYTVLEQLPAGGAEADIYIIEKDGIKELVKLYRKGVKVKETVLAQMQELSKRFPEHVVRIYEYGYCPALGRQYERMEYIEHGNLRQFVPWGYVSRSLMDTVYKEIKSAITTLHENGIVHRDLKPENIMVRKRKPLDLVFADFGMATALDQAMSSKMTGTVGGTLAYMAPECFAAVDGQVVTGREADLWAIGIILYEMIYGQTPFHGLSQAMIVHAIITKGVLVDEESVEPELRGYIPIVKALLRNDPKERGFTIKQEKIENTAEAPDYSIVTSEQDKDIGYKIGDTGPAGGIIFYDKGETSDGWRYLEAAPSNQGTEIDWFKNGDIDIKTRTAIGTGKANTTDIVDAQGAGNYAASLCCSLSLGGFSDWFLPSKDELSLMYKNLKQAGLGGFGDSWFWSSSQSNSYFDAWKQNFSDGKQYTNYRNYKNSVRACRAF